MRWSVRLVTDETTRRECDLFRQSVYRRYYENTPEDQWQSHELTPISIDQQLLEWTIAATRDDKVVGTCRVIELDLAERAGGQAESLRLFDWDRQRLAEIRNKPLDKMRWGELGRFAVSNDVDGDWVKRLLFGELRLLAQHRQFDGLLAIMPTVVRRSARRSGWTFLPVPGARLVHEDPDLLVYRKRFPDYFLNSSEARIPQLCFISIDAM